MASKQQFLREYIKAIRDGNAALFAGAGLSRPSGLVSWKELLRPMTDEIGLDIDEENDLTAAAQYVRNKSGNRAFINSSIMDAFSKDIDLNENVEIVTRLPIGTYWTTNYDHLIEEGLRKANRNADVKMESSQLSSTKRDRDAIVYKMHGDAEHASNAVLTKDDYVQYDRNYPFFRKVLQGDLISKTFLFVGFSFEDPNLESVLCQIRLLLDENIRNHYCIMKRVSRKDAENDEEFGFKVAQQNLREGDLIRYGIQTVFVDDFSEITEMLRDIEKAVLANNVFISGSASVYDSIWTKSKLEQLAYKISKRLAKEEFRIASGFGLGIGSAVINGAVDEINASKYKHLDEHLRLYPFPQGIEDDDERKKKWTSYRKNVLNDNGVIIFISGNKKDADGNKVIASGCLEEYKIAKEYGCMVIPIGTTGDASAKIFEDVKNNLSGYNYLEKNIDVLSSGTDIDEIVDMVSNILKQIRII